MYNDRHQRGMSYIETLIVVSVLSLMGVSLLLTNWKQRILEAKDTQRKADLAGIRQAFESYYGLHDCYPQMDALEQCGAASLTPSLSSVPCDPVDGTPYLYVSDDPNNRCRNGYRVCAHLDNPVDPDIHYIGCSSVNGCGWGDRWNYCIAVGTTVTKSGFIPQPGP